MKAPLISLLLATALAFPAYAADELVVYSARKEHLVKPLFDAYTQQTGVEIKYITDKAGPLLARLEAEGDRSPADMLITVDAGNLWHAAQTGVLGKVDSATLNSNVPAHLRDADGRWFGLSVRARTIVYSTERVQPGELSSYAALGGPAFKGRLCLRTSKKVYNQSLVASLIARHGEAEAERIVRSWVANLAVPPFSNDTKTMKAVAAGKCDVSIVNTYYYGRLMNKSPDLKLAIFWPNQDSTGVHVNVSGAGITAHAPHRAQAIKFLEWLSSDEAQAMFAGLNYEYPVNDKVAIDPVARAWGEFKPDDLPVAKFGEYQAAAVRLMDRAGYK